MVSADGMRGSIVLVILLARWLLPDLGAAWVATEISTINTEVRSGLRSIWKKNQPRSSHWSRYEEHKGMGADFLSAVAVIDDQVLFICACRGFASGLT